MTPERLAILALLAVALGQGYTLWLQRARRPAWWRRLDLHPLERVVLERFDALENNLTRVAAGLHEDVDALRQEIRAAVQLPPETEIPNVVRELRLFRLGFILMAVVVLALIAAQLSDPRVAQAEGPTTTWRVGRLTRDGSGSWWYGEVEDGLAPEVWADYGVRGVDYYAHCPAPAYQPQTCTIVAQGRWTVIAVDGEVLHRRGRVYLPAIAGGL